MGAFDDLFRELGALVPAIFCDTPVTITRTTKAIYDPRTGERLAPAPTTYSVLASPPFTPATEFPAGTYKETFSIFVPAKNLAIVPSTETDSLTRNGVIYNITRVESSPSGDSEAGWTLTCVR